MTTEIMPPQIKFYTTGYAGQEINDLKPMLGLLNAVLVDVRLSPNDSDLLLLLPGDKFI